MTSPDKQAVSGIAGIPSAAHAPAPWVIVDGDWLQSERGPLVGGRYFSLCITATSEADRNLLIAAPELLAGLQALLDKHVAHHNSIEHASARKTIAKALGQ